MDGWIQCGTAMECLARCCLRRESRLQVADREWHIAERGSVRRTDQSNRIDGRQRFVSVYGSAQSVRRACARDILEYFHSQPRPVAPSISAIRWDYRDAR